MLSGNYDIGQGGFGGIRVGGDRGRAGISQRSLYLANYSYATGRVPPRQLLGKRSPFKTDPSPPCPMPKIPVIPSHSPPVAATAAFSPMPNYPTPELYQTPRATPILVDQLPPLSALTPEAILRLQTGHEGQLCLTGVSSEDVRKWESQYPGVIENDNIRQEYNYLNGAFIIKCAPTPTHESVSQFFSDTLFKSLNKLEGEDTVDMVRIGGGMGK